MTLVELHESFCLTLYVLPVWALEKVLESTRKFFQRSHLVLSHLKQPIACASVAGIALFLLLEGASDKTRAAEIPRNKLLKPKVRDSKKIFPFVLTYNPN